VPPPRLAVRVAALVPPALILLGLLAHTVLEGLAIGLQVRPASNGHPRHAHAASHLFTRTAF
jgi:hypothetical protein